MTKHLGYKTIYESYESLNEIYNNQNILAPQAEHYLQWIAKQDSQLFAYLKEEEKTRLLNQLRHAALIIHAQYRLSRALCLNDIESLKSALLQCTTLLKKLGFLEEPFTSTGSFLAPVQKNLNVLQQVKNTLSRFSALLAEMISNLNEARLYWLWMGSVFEQLEGLISLSFKVSTAGLAIFNQMTGVIGGYTSWAFYSARAILNGILVFLPAKTELTFAQFQFNEGLSFSYMENTNEPDLENFSYATLVYNRAKAFFFLLANDLTWAPANGLTFTLLVGNGLLGWLGVVLNGVLFAYDITLCLARQYKVESLYKTQEAYFDQQLKALQDKEGTDAWQLKEVNEMLAQIKNKRNEQRWEFLNELFCAIGILIGCTFIFLLFIPPSIAILPVTTFMLITIGNLIGLATSIIYYTNQHLLAMRYISKEYNGVKAELAQLLISFKERNENEITLEELHRAFIEHMHLRSELDYKRQSITFEVIKMEYTLALLTIAPAIVFTGFLMAPMSAAVAVLVSTIIAAVTISLLLKKLAPKKIKQSDVEVPNTLEPLSPVNYKVKDTYSQFWHKNKQQLSNDSHDVSKQQQAKLHYFKNRFFKSASIKTSISNDPTALIPAV